MQALHGTTILLVRRNGKVAVGGDGQVTLANSIILKGNARKVRRLYDNKVLVGFAGSTADATTLIDLFDKELSKNSGNLLRSAISLAKSWRTDRMLRRLEAVLAVADKERLLMLTGNGDVIEPEHDLVAIGSGGDYARAAALAFLEGTSLSAREIVERSLKIAANICVFTNDKLIIEEIGSEKTGPEEIQSAASGK